MHFLSLLEDISAEDGEGNHDITNSIFRDSPLCSPKRGGWIAILRIARGASPSGAPRAFIFYPLQEG